MGPSRRGRPWAQAGGGGLGHKQEGEALGPSRRERPGLGPRLSPLKTGGGESLGGLGPK